MPTNDLPDDEPQQWWLDLTVEQRAFIAKLIGSNQFPNPSLEEVGRVFDDARKRIHEIEARALRRLKK